MPHILIPGRSDPFIETDNDAGVQMPRALHLNAQTDVRVKFNFDHTHERHAKLEVFKVQNILGYTFSGKMYRQNAFAHLDNKVLLVSLV